MKYTIRIFELTNKNKLQDLVQTILKQKTMSMQDVIEGLQNPPLNIPIEASPEYIIKLKDKLKESGAKLKVIIQDANENNAEILYKDEGDEEFDLQIEREQKTKEKTQKQPKPTIPPTDPKANNATDSKPSSSGVAGTRMGAKDVPKFKYTPTKKKKTPSKTQQIILFVIFFLPIVLLIFFYEEKSSPVKGAHLAGEVKVVKTSLSELEGEKKAEELYVQAMTTSDDEEAQKLLKESLAENPYNDKAWDKIIKSYEESGNYGFAKKAREEKRKKSTSVKKAIQAIALELNRRNTRFTVNSSIIEMDLSHIKSSAIYKARAAEIYTLLKEIHPDKKISFINRSLKTKIQYENKTMLIKSLD